MWNGGLLVVICILLYYCLISYIQSVTDVNIFFSRNSSLFKLVNVYLFTAMFVSFFIFLVQNKKTFKNMAMSILKCVLSIIDVFTDILLMALWVLRTGDRVWAGLQFLILAVHQGMK